MAEDDDDDGFGDFTFASFNPSFNSQPRTHQSGGLKSPITTTLKDDGDDDDEWGDFVDSPLGSFTSSHDTPSKSSSVDPFNLFSRSQNPTSRLEKSEFGNSTRAEFEPAWMQKTENQNQNGWVKLKGAIPLSIFGEVEEEEKEEEVGRSGPSDPRHIDGKDSNIKKKVDNVSDRLKSDGNLGVSFNYDAITSLYNEQVSPNHHNSVGMHLNGMNSDTNGVDISKKDSTLELSGLNLVAVSMHKRSDSDSVMNLSSQTLQRKVQDGVHASSNGISSNLNALDLDFSGWNADFNDNSNLSFDVTKNVNVHSLQTIDEISMFQLNSNGIGFDKKDTNYSLFDGLILKSDVIESKLFSSSSNTNGVDVALNFNGRNEELGGSDKDDGDDDDDDDDEWEFKDAHAPSQVSESNVKVRYDVEKTSGDMAVSKLGNGTYRPTKLFTASNGSSDLFSMSNGFPSKSDLLDIGLGISSSNTADNKFPSDAYLSGDQTGSKAMLDPHLVAESAESDEDFGEFAAACGETGGMLEVDSKEHEISEINASSLGFKGSNGSVDFSVFSGSYDLFLPSNGKFGDSNEVSAVFDINPTASANDEAARSSYTFDTYLRDEQTEGQDLWDPDLVIQSAKPDDNFGEFREASAEDALKKHEMLEIGNLSQSELETAKHDGNLQEKETKSDQYKGALPLSIFGDEEEKVDGSPNTDNTFMLQPASSKGNDHSPNSSISINDLISNLYSQAEQISSASSLHTQVLNGLDPSDSVSVSNLVNDADGDDNNSWEFRGSFSRGVTENENAHEISSGKLKLQSYADFYSKLKDKLYFIAKVHLASLKETQSAFDSCEDENWATLVAEIQDASKELGPENEITKEDNMENHTCRDVNFNDFVEVLQEPKFHALQAEYNLERKFLLVEKDVRSVIDLMQHAKTMLKILMMGSLEDQSSYVSIWSKIISACAQEMQHGALIWRQSLQKNIHSEILAEPQGKTFVLALGEIYRAALLLGATIKLYKPWILSSHVELSRLYSLLEECHSSWSSSGLEEALSIVLDDAPSEGYHSLPSILDSIKYIYDLDELVLQNQVFIQQEPLCRLSLLTPSVAPGMATIAWDGELCFLRLANLWVNLVSSDHPKLPPIPVNG